MGRGRDRTGEGLVLTAHVQITAVEVDVGVIVNLIVARTSEANRRARIDRTVVTEGVDARSGLGRQDQGARIHVHPKGIIIEDATEGERARPILGEIEGA